jgi:hypothetical protein
MAFQSGVTLLVQGTTTAPLLRLLGFLQLQPTQEDAMRHAAAAVEECGKPAQGGRGRGAREGGLEAGLSWLHTLMARQQAAGTPFLHMKGLTCTQS